MGRIYKSLALIIASLCIIMSADAQDVKQNIIKANLISPLVRTGSFFYERVLNEDMSLQMGFFYSGASISDTRFRGFGITPEFRYYLSESKPAPSGIFVAPYLRYQSFDLSAEGSTGSATYSTMGGGMLVGTQRLLKNAISLEAFIGPSYSNGNIKIKDGAENDFDTGFFDGFGVRFGFTVGLAL
ncbi:MAG: DUF3575 domain-containing protein [Bacteroidales bacterium]